MRIRENEGGPTHCARCGAEFGKPRVFAVFFGVPVHGDVVYADYEGSVLCELCMNREVEEHTPLEVVS